MSEMDRINDAFRRMLRDVPRGISNTSASKYNEIKQLVADATGIPTHGIVATGAASDRITNLDSRFPQGNQRGQHAPLGLAFIKVLPQHQAGDRQQVIEKYVAKAVTTSEKFLNGQERGTTFDGILILVQFEGEDWLTPAMLLAETNWDAAQRVCDTFGVEKIQRITRTGQTAEQEQAIVKEAEKAVAAGHPPDLLRECTAALDGAGLRLPEAVLHRFLAALLAKRFVILQGLSGSGKSQLALCVAKWFQELEDQVAMVAVGADWTSNEHVLGFHDALDDKKYRRPSSGALDVVLAASADPSRPYFLILDEMNLSHVERYFADMLSSIESREPISLHSLDEDVDGVPPRIDLPANLFVVGTINVDETTYAFSPKVLDRANVIEFTLNANDMKGFLGSSRRLDTAGLEGTGKHYGAWFATAAAQEVTVSKLPPEIASEDQTVALDTLLMELFQQLKPFGWEFGFRVAAEVHRFVYWHALLSGGGWELREAMDCQVIQKVMPKLRGSERRLKPVLQALQEFSKRHDFKRASEKCSRMLESAKDGFVSFAEA